MPPSCCQIVSARMAMAATAARNRALRGGSKNAKAPTGTKNNTPRPLATPPQVCSSRTSTNMSTDACRIVCTCALARRWRTNNDANQAKTKIKYGRRRRTTCGSTRRSRARRPKSKDPNRTKGTKTRYKLRTASTRQTMAGSRLALWSMRRSNWRFNCVISRYFALPSSLIQNSAPYATRSALRDNS